MDINLETQENNQNNYSSNDSKYKEEANEEYRNSLNNNLCNQETNFTTDDKTKKLFDKNSITKKIFRIFMKFLIKDLNIKLKKSLKTKFKFKNIVCDLKKETINSIFNSSLKNVFETVQISKRYKGFHLQNKKLIEIISKNKETEIKSILSLKVKNYFKNNFMNSETNVKEILNKNKKITGKKQLINFEIFLHNIKCIYKYRLDVKNLNQYIKKIEQVADEIISDIKNEDIKEENEIKSDENNIVETLTSEKINAVIQNCTNEFNESFFYSDSNLSLLNNDFNYNDIFFNNNLFEYEFL